MRRNKSGQLSIHKAVEALSLASLVLLAVLVDAVIYDRYVVLVEEDLLLGHLIPDPLGRELVILGRLLGLLELGPELVDAGLLPLHLGAQALPVERGCPLLVELFGHIRLRPAAL